MPNISFYLSKSKIWIFRAWRIDLPRPAPYGIKSPVGKPTVSGPMSALYRNAPPKSNKKAAGMPGDLDTSEKTFGHAVTASTNDLGGHVCIDSPHG